MTLSLYLKKLPMKTITFILSILFSATVFSQSLVEKSFPKEELFSLGSYYYPEQWDSSQWERDLKKCQIWELSSPILPNSLGL